MSLMYELGYTLQNFYIIPLSLFYYIPTVKFNKTLTIDN